VGDLFSELTEPTGRISSHPAVVHFVRHSVDREDWAITMTSAINISDGLVPRNMIFAVVAVIACSRFSDSENEKEKKKKEET